MEHLDHVPTPAELAQLYAQSEQDDPRSLFYKRTLVRPKIPVRRLLLGILLAVAVFAGAYFPAASLLTPFWSAWIAVGAVLLLCLVCVKPIFIMAVKLYQALAPAGVRNRCRYEPSCSAYMLLCLEKYGFCKGLKKGLARWRGCKPPNGGYDYP